MRGTQWRIASAYVLLIVVTMGAVTAYLFSFVRATYLEDLGARLEDQVELVGLAALPYVAVPRVGGPLQAIVKEQGALTGARITIIAADGTVLADAWEDPATMESHATRPEVVAAMQQGSGSTSRYSTTLRESLMYRAIAVGRDPSGRPLAVARVALPVSRVEAALRHILFVVAGAAAIVTVLAALVAVAIARRQTRSLRAIAQVANAASMGNLARRAPVDSRDEIGEVGRAFNAMAASLQRMVRELASERDKLEAVLATMSDGVVVVAPDGAVLLANAAAEHLTGAILRCSPPPRLMDAVRDHVVKDVMDRCLSTEVPQQQESSLVRTGRYVRIIAAPMARPDRGTLLLLQDRTEAHRVEVTRREFAANVSHELRTPLSAIKALVDTLRSGGAQDARIADDFLRRVEDETDRMARLVNELLELSRLETGQVSLALAPVSPRHLLEQAVERFRPLAAARGQTLVLEAPMALPDINADAELVHRVLANFLSNAMRFTPAGGEITVAGTAEDGAVRLEVRDTGLGIPPEHQPHVFERFYKVERSRRSEGTGLGLAVAKHIVQLHGGSIGVRSREGEGSAFWFTLPVAPS